MKNTQNYKEWLEEDYMRKLRLKLSQMYAKVGVLFDLESIIYSIYLGT